MSSVASLSFNRAQTKFQELVGKMNHSQFLRTLNSLGIQETKASRLRLSRNPPGMPGREASPGSEREDDGKEQGHRKQEQPGEQEVNKRNSRQEERKLECEATFGQQTGRHRFLLTVRLRRRRSEVMEKAELARLGNVLMITQFQKWERAQKLHQEREDRCPTHAGSCTN